MMENNDQIGEYEFEVEAFHVDYTGALSFGFLGNKMLIAADHEANKLGFGKLVLAGQRKSWVISRLAVEMHRYPREYEKYYIQTWVKTVNRLFTVRCFRVLDADRNVLGDAHSVWSLIDIDTRQSVDLTKFCGGAIQDAVRDEPCPVDGVTRVRVSAEQPMGHFIPLYSDLDYNGHLNSIKYVEHILNELPLEAFKSHFVKRVEVSYSEECFYRERLDVYMDTHADGKQYDVEIHKQPGVVACRARVVLSD